MIPILAPLLVLPEESVPVLHWSHLAGDITYVVADNEVSVFDWKGLIGNVLWVIYFVGVLVVLLKMMYGLTKIFRYYRQGQREDFNGYRIITTEAVHLPFSFFNSIYISRHVPLQDHIHTILEHEEIHIRQWHTLDVLMAEMVHAFFWFNPVMIFYKRALRQAHEYLADDLICRKNSVSSYTELLLSKSQSGLELALTNQFFHSQIKERIQMMTTHKTNRSAAWKYALVLPLLLGLVILFSSSTIKQQLQDVVSAGHDSIPKPPPPPAPPILNGNAVMPEGVMAIIVEETFIKVDLKNGVSKYYYKNDASDMQEFENFYGKIPSHDMVPPPPPPIPNLINTDPQRFAKEMGFDGKMPLFVIDDRVIKQEKINIHQEDIKLIRVKKCDSNIQDLVKKFGKQAENGAILIYTKSFKGCILEEPVNEVFKVVEQMPRFPGCENEASEHEKKDCSNRKMLDYIYSHLKYPAEAKDKIIEGNVVAQFTINKDGGISDINIITEIGYGCGQAVIEMLQTMNDMPEKWVPGKQAGRNVNVLYTLPVKFKMTDDQPKTEISIGSQSKDIPQDALKSMVEMATFPGSEQIHEPKERMSTSIKEMTKFLQKQLKYPTKAKENNIEGTVYIRMTIDSKGKITDAMIKEDIGFGCGDEALRVVKMMPNWIPATIDGKVVASSQTIPIGFKLKSDGKSLDIKTIIDSGSKFEMHTGSDVSLRIMGDETTEDIGFKKGDMILVKNDIVLKENVDYSVDYKTGKLSILNQKLLEEKGAFNISFSNGKLNNISKDLVVKVYPNPTSDLIELSLTGSKEDVEVSILDMAGKLLYKNKFDNRQEHFKTKIDISQINVPTILVKTVQGKKVSTNQVVIRK
jgi:TonB family protein